MQKKWIIKDPNKDLSDKISKNFNISPIVAQVLINRGIGDFSLVESFLNNDLSYLLKPQRLNGVEKAVARIRSAIAEREDVLIYGDYDVDGITSVALLYDLLTRLGAKTHFYIPNRLDEGYGLNIEAAQRIVKEKYKLVITVDCGTNASKEISFLQKTGVDVIVVDHHHADKNEFAKEALCVVNPLQEGDDYPFKDMAGVGLVFKLAWALLGDLEEASEYLDLVCLGTVSDIAPVVGENRILIRHGLKRIMESRRIGIRHLLKVCSLGSKTLSYYHVGFMLGPRINASGRLGSPEIALKLLLTSNETEASNMARMLDRANRDRQDIETQTLKDAIRKIEQEINFKEHRAIVLADENWHPGVIGIVASRIVDRYYRPTILISLSKDKGRGSGRSIKNFYLYDAVEKCKDFLHNFGGHKWACGITIERDKIKSFSDRFNEISHKLLQPDDLVPAVEIDAEIGLGDINQDFISQLDMLSPYGPGNRKPLFMTRDLKLKKGIKFFKKGVASFWVQGASAVCEVVAFRMQETAGLDSEGRILNLVYSPSLNRYNGLTNIRLNLEDIRLTDI